MPSTFLSKTQYAAEHPDALAVYCSDGRFTRAVEELLLHQGHARLDTLTLPGGPGLLAPLTSYGDRETVSRAASFLITGHHIKHLVLLAHEGCGYYRERMPGASAEQIEERQVQDLRGARDSVLLTHPSLEVRLHYLRVAGKQVQFDEL
jgi:carbonic anhydrase